MALPILNSPRHHLIIPLLLLYYCSFTNGFFFASHDTMIDFERADLREEYGWPWFASNWKRHHDAMAGHALASYGVFQWKSFRGWLTANKDNEKDFPGIGGVLKKFQGHPVSKRSRRNRKKASGRRKGKKQQQDPVVVRGGEPIRLSTVDSLMGGGGEL